ncbi:MAG: HVO_0476 family zinc finger protein [Thermoplasmata archaeon]
MSPKKKSKEEENLDKNLSIDKESKKEKEKKKKVTAKKKEDKEKKKESKEKKQVKKSKKKKKAKPYKGPKELFSECYVCGKETLHEVIKGRFAGKKEETIVGVLRCTECGTTKKEVVKEEKPISVRLVISEEKESKKSEMKFLPNEEVKVNDEIDFPDGRLLVTSIETTSGRVKSAYAKDIVTIWTKKFENVKVKLAVNRGEETLSLYSYSAPEEEYRIGDEIDIDGMKVRIHAIKTKDKMLDRGTAEARDIVRIYGKEVTPESERRARAAARRREIIEERRKKKRERAKAEEKARYEQERARRIELRRELKK